MGNIWSWIASTHRTGLFWKKNEELSPYVVITMFGWSLDIVLSRGQLSSLSIQIQTCRRQSITGKAFEDTKKRSLSPKKAPSYRKQREAVHGKISSVATRWWAPILDWTESEKGRQLVDAVYISYNILRSSLLTPLFSSTLRGKAGSLEMSHLSTEVTFKSLMRMGT